MTRMKAHTDPSWAVDRIIELEAEVGRAVALLGEARDYLDHQSWRCAHPPHYYLAGDPPEDDCACGLDSFERRLRAAVAADDERRNRSLEKAP
jgi:hypothetical protein